MKPGMKTYTESVQHLKSIRRDALMSGSQAPDLTIIHHVAMTAWIYDIRSSKVWKDIENADRG